MSILSCSVYAQNWTKEITKDFSKEKNVAVVIDLSEAMIMDVPISEYPEYYSGKFSSNEKYANLVLEKFKNRFVSNFCQKCKRNAVSEEEARFTVTYKINSISENGGFSGVYWVSDKGNKSETISFNRKDGRWNDFEKLLMENVDKFWKSVANSQGGVKGNPYNDKLFSKKK